MRHKMKGLIKTIALVGALATLGACSSYTTIAERDTYAQPKWYAKCAQEGTEGWFWWSKDYVYACGSGQSVYQQAAEEQMYAVAMNNFAKRINGKVNSETSIEFNNDKRQTNTFISYKVTDTKVRQHIEEERGTYIYAGNTYTFVKLRMPKEVFDGLIAGSN